MNVPLVIETNTGPKRRAKRIHASPGKRLSALISSSKPRGKLGSAIPLHAASHHYICGFREEDAFTANYSIQERMLEYWRQKKGNVVSQMDPHAFLKANSYDLIIWEERDEPKELKPLSIDPTSPRYFRRIWFRAKALTTFSPQERAVFAASLYKPLSEALECVQTNKKLPGILDSIIEKRQQIPLDRFSNKSSTSLTLGSTAVVTMTEESLTSTMDDSMLEGFEDSGNTWNVDAALSNSWQASTPKIIRDVPDVPPTPIIKEGLPSCAPLFDVSVGSPVEKKPFEVFEPFEEQNEVDIDQSSSIDLAPPLAELRSDASPSILKRVSVLLHGMNQGRVDIPAALDLLRNLDRDCIALAWLATIYHPDYDNDTVGIEVDREESRNLWERAIGTGLYEQERTDPLAMWLCGNRRALKGDDSEALKLYHKAADFDLPQAQYQLGQVYRMGLLGLEGPDYDRAFEFYQRAASQGMAAAQLCVALCYQQGKGVPELDIEIAVEFMEKAAYQGDVRAQYRLGLCWQRGQGVGKQDHRLAVEYYRAAARETYPLAQCHLGMCYAKGLGVETNHEKAFKNYQLAASQGLAIAFNQMGACYQTGQGVEQNRGEALNCYHKAAPTHVDAQFNVGLLYLQDGNFRDGWQWVRRAARANHIRAQGLLGASYLHGRYGLKRDLPHAVRWLRAAAKRGDASSQCHLGIHYHERDKASQALSFWRRAAQRGHPRGQYWLALCYDRGWGVEVDKQRAIKYYRYSAKQGHAHAQYNLACSLQDDGNDGEAIKYLEMAVEQNLPEALCNLAVCYQTASGVSCDPEQAFTLFSTAAKAGSSQAQYNIGLCYEEGIGVDRDEDLALQHYHQAAGSQHRDALSALGLCYEQGHLGVSPDETLACMYYEQASALGDEQAIERLRALMVTFDDT